LFSIKPVMLNDIIIITFIVTICTFMLTVRLQIGSQQKLSIEKCWNVFHGLHSIKEVAVLERELFSTNQIYLKAFNRL